MSKKKEEELREEQAWNRIDDAVIESEHFLEKYLKPITITIVVLAVIASAYFAYNHFVTAPKNAQAQASLFKAEEYFRNGLDSLAIHGDGNAVIGFETIIDQYGSTEAGNLAKLYAGISYARLGDAEKALSYLKGYNGKDLIVSHLVEGAIGDCLVQQGKAEEAVAHYIKAAKAVDNDAQSPVLYKKAADVYRSLGKHDQVIEIYTTVKENYSNSNVAMEADKYIEEAQALKK